MQNGASLLDAAHILTSDNMNQIKRRLEDIDKKREQMIAQQQQAEQQMAQQTNEIQQQQMAAEATMQQEELRIKEEDSIRKAETQIAVAEISAQNSGGVTEQPAIMPEEIEMERAKINIQSKKVEQDSIIKQKQLAETVRKNLKDEELKAQEIAIRKKIANKPVSKPAKR
jgi:hypothetical protein